MRKITPTDRADMPGEIWARWGEYHEVSNKGRVRSVVFYPNGGKKAYGGYILKPQITGNGYLVVYPRGHGTRKRAYVHRMVLEAFVGPCPDGYWAAHYNGVRQDNSLENLRWDTPANNQADKVRHGTSRRKIIPAVHAS